MAEQRYNKKEPNLTATYKTVREFYGREEYFKRFFKRLHNSLVSSYGLDKATEIFRLVGSPQVKIKGFEKFYSVGLTLDVGTAAYTRSKNRNSKNHFLLECKKRVEEVFINGEQDVDVTPAFLYLPYFTHSTDELKEAGKVLLDMFTTYCKNPFILKLYTRKLGKTKYWREYRTLMKVVANTVRNDSPDSQKNYPKLHRMLYILDLPRRKVIDYLQNLCAHSISPQAFVDCFEGIDDPSSYEPKVCEAFEKVEKLMGREAPFGEWMHDHVVEMLNETTFIPFLSERSKAEACRLAAGDFVKDVFARMEAEDYYLWQGSLDNEAKSPIIDITLNCKNYRSVDKIYSVLDNLVLLSLEKERVSKLGNFISNVVHRITLAGFTGFNRDAVEKIEERVKKLKSKYNKEVEVDIQFDPSVVESRTGVPNSGYIRVVSDLHVDVNGPKRYDFAFGTDFVLNCGDTSGNSHLSRDFIQTHTFRGVVVAGNHLGYDSIYGRDGIPAYIPEDEPLKRANNAKNKQLRFLQGFFSLNNEVSLLENQGVERMGIYFYGTTLYTDFSLFGENNKVACMMEASRGMNDFRNCIYLKSDLSKPKGQRIVIEPWTAETQKIKFAIAKKMIQGMLTNQTRYNPDTPIVVVTHYAPTTLAVADQYKNDPLSASFAVDMTFLIDNFPQIRLFAFGHTHSPFDFIYKGCRFVCNPFGYYNENGVDVSEYGTRIKVEDIKSGKPWEEILENEIREGLVKVYE